MALGDRCWRVDATRAEATQHSGSCLDDVYGHEVKGMRHKGGLSVFARVRVCVGHHICGAV